MVEKFHVPVGHSSDWWPSIADPLRQFGAKVAEYFSPTADASASDAQYEINLELPGVAEQDIDITVHDGNLIVKGDKKSHHEERGRTYFFTERSYGAFQRTFRLPGDTDTKAISAEFKDGVLTLKLPKAANESTTKKIKVNRT